MTRLILTTATLVILSIDNQASAQIVDLGFLKLNEKELHTKSRYIYSDFKDKKDPKKDDKTTLDPNTPMNPNNERNRF